MYLVIASWLGFPEIVTLLLKNGANINEADDHVGAPLQAAAAKGHSQIVSLLLEKGADINQQSDPYGTVLTAASWHNHIENLSALFWGPLAAAAKRGNLEVVKLI
ncbi:hypothetical protein N7471_010359 [Penicillium samsonianum]|uniref:uncharacterized protein n=1 Tax=Penicillium samsonianum TaxID=1882272 RepID=UPI002549B8BE|nr:uncharacterized protein N7471_010359 [Penicillium samsonianum]KAJ6125866.1 hypothetical protein N7471_010359 [Penicillium samsonianum]